MIEEKEHAPIGGSTIKKVMRCHGMISLAATCPEPPESEAAREGTEAHLVMEKLLKGLLSADDLRILHNDEMVDHALEFEAIIYDHLDIGDVLLVEEKTDLTEVFEIPPGWAAGTADVSIVRIGEILRVWDYKYGVGEIVEVEMNEQAIFYALGIAHKYGYNFKEVELGIFQPRARHSDGAFRTFTMTMEDLLEQKRIMAQHAQAVVLHGDKTLFAGDHCKWCKAIPKCPAIRLLDFNSDDFDVIDLSADEATERLPQASDKDLSPMTLSLILRKLPAVEAWVKAMYEYAEDFTKRGGRIPGFKRVRGRGSRVWGKPKVTEGHFFGFWGHAVYEETKLLSPAQMEKMLVKTGLSKAQAKKEVDKYTVRMDGAINLVSEADGRPSIEEQLIDTFELL